MRARETKAFLLWVFSGKELGDRAEDRKEKLPFGGS
jgi:hypothetical protein